MRHVWLVLIVIAVACGKKKPAAAPGPQTAEGELQCPAAMWKPGEMRPAHIEVINQSQDSVIVFLDRCLGHTRVGDLAALETQLLPMPNGAVSYRGLLRFFTYRGPARQVGVELAPTDADPHLRLVIPAVLTTDCPQVIIDGQPGSSLARIPKDSIASIKYEPAPKDDLRACARIIVERKK